MGMGRKFGALGAFPVGVKDKAVMVHALEQHHAHIGPAMGVHRGQRHGVGIVGFDAFGFLQPAR